MRCIYADPDNLNKFNKSHSGLLAQMYLQLSKSGKKGATYAAFFWGIMNTWGVSSGIAADG